MRSRNLSSYIWLALFVVMVVSLPAGSVAHVKAMAFSLFPSLWSSTEFYKERTKTKSKEFFQLQQENRILKEKLAKLKKQLSHEEWVAGQIERLKEIRAGEVPEQYWRDFFQRRSSELAFRLEKQLIGVAARVIFRDPSLWSSHLWIDIGHEENEKSGGVVVAKNSPVVVDNCLVGIVEEVEKRRSRVRLITDMQLVPAVRAIRGEQVNRRFLELTGQMIDMLRSRKGLYGSPEEEELAIGALEKIKTSVVQAWGDHYLAKGELCGSGDPLWRAKQPLLRGSGFNYDFADEEGLARELRSGEILHEKGRNSLALLLPGDLLVTSGFDGVFPEGLEVAIVAGVGTLREGASTYDLEAIPIVSNLTDLSDVWVLPPN